MEDKEVKHRRAVEEAELKEVQNAAFAAEEEKQQQIRINAFFAKNNTQDKKNDSDWEILLKNYEQKYPDAPKREDGALVFDGPDSAKEFFDSQAKEGLKFFSSEVNERGELTGQHMFSCGTGTLYSGTAQEIQSALEKDLEKSPNDAKLQGGLLQVLAYRNATEKQQKPQEEASSSMSSPKSSFDTQSTQEKAAGNDEVHKQIR